jgi:hypothetical protein
MITQQISVYRCTNQRSTALQTKETSHRAIRRRLQLIAVLAGTGATAISGAMVHAETAQAYQLPGSSWTWWRDNSNNNWTNSRGDHIDWEDSHHMSGCTVMHISGDSNVVAGDSSSVYRVGINDSWTHSISGVGITVYGVGVGTGGGSNTGSWNSTATTWKLQHNYRDDTTTGINSSVSGGWYYNIARNMQGTWKYGTVESASNRSRNEYVC